METVEISKLFQDNINKVLTPNGYKHIIRRDNNLSRFDILNRILIEIQYPNAYDVRTSEEWLIDNRNVKTNSKGISIMLPVYSSKYIDAETGEEIDVNDLTLDELNEAIQHNVVLRKDSLETTCIKQLYDIRQTISLDNSKYTVSKPIIKSSSIINMFQAVTGCTVEYGDMTYYSKSKNILTVSKQKYTDLATNLVDILVDFYIKTAINNVCNGDDIDFSEYDIDLIKYTLQYSIDTLLRDNRDCEFDIVRHTSTDKLLLILNIVDSIVSGISENIEYNNSNISRDVVSSIETLKKAEALLNIMEANNISKIMKGA